MGLSRPLVVLNDVGLSAILSQLFEPVFTKTRAKTEGPEPLRRDRQAQDLTDKPSNHSILNRAVSKHSIYTVSYSFIDTVMFCSKYGPPSADVTRKKQVSRVS